MKNGDIENSVLCSLAGTWEYLSLSEKNVLLCLKIFMSLIVNVENSFHLS